MIYANDLEKCAYLFLVVIFFAGNFFGKWNVVDSRNAVIDGT